MNEARLQLFKYYTMPLECEENCNFLCCSNCLKNKWYVRLKKFLWSEWDGVDDVDHLQLEQRRTDPLSNLEDINSQYSQYDDFQTIDWPREIARDHSRHRFIETKYKEQRVGICKQLWDSCSAWLCVFLVGGACGAVAAFIDIGTGWLSDLKEGFCSTAFWFNREQCCWSSNTSFYKGNECEEWLSWSSRLGYTNGDANFFVQYIIYILWALTFSMLAALLVHTFAPYAVGGGIPEIKTVLSGYIIRGLLGKWTLIIKTIGVMLAVAAGLVLGKEGPLVHVSCCIGNMVSYFFVKYGQNEAKKREILSAASAAGVSVAFGAPIGGVLFSLEEVSYYFPMKTLWRTFFCALVASFTLTSINPFGNDHLIVFYVDYKTPWVLFELLPFAVIGILGGLLGSLFIKANVFICKLRKTSLLGKYPLTEIAVVTVVTALVSFPMEYTRIDTSQLIADLVRNCKVTDHSDLCDYADSDFDMKRSVPGEGMKRAMWQLALTFLIKFMLLIVTAGIKLPAGLYIPSLAIGAIFGRMIGTGMEQLAIAYPNAGIFRGECASSCVTPGLYAMVGAAAMLGGVTRMTVGLVVIIFEVTGGVRYIIPVMTAVMCSKWIGDAFCKKGIFEALIELNDYPFLDIKEEFHETTIVADVMKPRNNQPLVVLTQTMTLETIENIFLDYDFNGFPVVVSEESQYLIGFVLRKDLFKSMRNAKFKFQNIAANTEVLFTECNCREENSRQVLDFTKIVDETTVTISTKTPMEAVVEMFKKLGLRQLLITHKGRVLGIITKKDVAHHVKHFYCVTDVGETSV